MLYFPWKCPYSFFSLYKNGTLRHLHYCMHRELDHRIEGIWNIRNHTTVDWLWMIFDTVKFTMIFDTVKFTFSYHKVSYLVCQASLAIPIGSIFNRFPSDLFQQSNGRASCVSTFCLHENKLSFNVTYCTSPYVIKPDGSPINGCKGFVVSNNIGSYFNMPLKIFKDSIVDFVSLEYKYKRNFAFLIMWNIDHHWA